MVYTTKVIDHYVFTNSGNYALADVNSLMIPGVDPENQFFNNVTCRWVYLNDDSLSEYKELLHEESTSKIKEKYLTNMYLPYYHNNRVYFGLRHTMEQIMLNKKKIE
jgi:hypothetical protein